MFNNINDNDFLYNSQLDKQSNIINLAALKNNANKLYGAKVSGDYTDRTEISSNAMELFQRDCDINKFNKIALTDLDNLDYLDRMNELFADGVIDVFEDDALQSLVDNQKLWDDLEL